MRLAENLSKLKTIGSFNDAQLANYVGVSEKTVKRVLSNRAGPNAGYNPSYRTVRSIAKSLGVTSDEIFKHRMHIEVLA